MLLKVGFTAFHFSFFPIRLYVGFARRTLLQMVKSIDSTSTKWQQSKYEGWCARGRLTRLRSGGGTNKCVAFSIFSVMKCVKLRTNKTSKHFHCTRTHSICFCLNRQGLPPMLKLLPLASEQHPATAKWHMCVCVCMRRICCAHHSYLRALTAFVYNPIAETCT